MDTAPLKVIKLCHYFQTLNYGLLLTAKHVYKTWKNKSAVNEYENKLYNCITICLTGILKNCVRNKIVFVPYV